MQYLKDKNYIFDPNRNGDISRKHAWLRVSQAIKKNEENEKRKLETTTDKEVKQNNPGIQINNPVEPKPKKAIKAQSNQTSNKIESSEVRENISKKEINALFQNLSKNLTADITKINKTFNEHSNNQGKYNQKIIE